MRAQREIGRSESCWRGQTCMLDAFRLCLDFATAQGQVFLCTYSQYPSHCFFLWLGRHCGRSVQICGSLGQVVVVSTHLCHTHILNKAEYSTVSATVNRHIVSRKFDLKLMSTGLGRCLTFQIITHEGTVPRPYHVVQSQVLALAL